jgi:hypothetical protein
VLAAYQTEIANSESTANRQPGNKVIDDNLMTASLSDDSMPRAPPAEDSLPRGPPANTGEYLLLDGAPIYDGTENSINQAQLDALLQYALQLWTDYGLTSDQQDRLDNISVQLAELDGGILGEARGNDIYIDFTAGGRGWFVDTTPGENSEFNLVDGEFNAIPGGEAAGRVDLLSVLVHEIGHVLGHDHDSGLAVMGETLATGIRLTLNDSGAWVSNDAVSGSITQNGSELSAGSDTGPLTFTIVGDADGNGLNGLDILVSGAANASDNTTYSNISEIVGGSGNDTLVGADGFVNTWAVTGNDSGQVQTDFTGGPAVLVFSSIENLSGGNALDIFAIWEGAGISGSITDSAGIELQLFEYFYVSGNIGIENANGDLRLSDGTLFSGVNYQIFTATGANAVVGLNGPAYDGVTSDPQATGLSLTGIDFSLLMFTDDNTGTHYTALNTSGNSASFVGFDEIQLDILSFAVQFNQTSDSLNPGRVLDFNPGGSVSGIGVSPSPSNPSDPTAPTPPAFDFEGENGALLEVNGNLELSIQDFVKAAGFFDITRKSSSLVDDGVNGVNPAFTGDVLSVNISGAHFFAGMGAGDFTYDGVTGALTGIDTTNAVGFEVRGANLDLSIINEIGGAERSWKGIAASIGQMTPVGIDPNTFVLEVRDLSLLYNAKSAFDDSKLDWDNLTSDGLVSGLTGLESTVDLIVSGNLEVGVQGFVRLAGGFSITKQSGVTVDDGAAPVASFTGDVLSLNLSNVFLFVGTGAGAFSYDVDDIVDGIDTTNAIGFLAADAGLGLSIISETTGTRSWMAIAGHIALMTPAGANEFTLAAKNLDLLYNGAASEQIR